MTIKCPFGITSSQISAQNFEEIWDVILDGGEEAYFQTKETFLHEQEDFTFEYKYVLQLVGVILDDESEDVKFFSNLFMVPTTKYIHPDILTKIIESYEKEKVEHITADEILFETSCPLVAKETLDLKEKAEDWYGWDWIEIEEIKDYLIKANESIKLINGLRGFFLDKKENLLGNTGWDFLKELLFNVDSTQLALDRYDKYIKERKLV